MSDYIVYSTHMKPSKIKGEFPDIFYEYIAVDSAIGFFYTLTNDRENAYIFDESQLEDARFIADCWRMKIKEV
ncbi:hypothetical protein JUJ52_08715 [Virgibacillus sp. AGTR]|uniref:hypothetical protein n=1 Tax=Virgibacillus sp. AGTR TaxID=2812055 RepID=UPI001962E691|nr:hypothetical protein [Virgibacillus sp. AGTR]MCC2250047.1 hypothetical protein [Virgibacillus sp. AGTR]QRZ17502.1 hypothetical protein JUJ52_17290 [Virgibacillus sp. AGTR]